MTRSRAHAVLVLALALLASGCARLFDHYDVGPDGLARADARIRALLVTERDSSALARLLRQRDALPSDPLLARLYAGIVAYHAGDFARSAAILDSATILIDERATKSATRAALSILSSDRVLRYQVGATERLLVHYYGALAWLRHGSVEDAAVEARRMTLLLEQTTPDDRAARELHAAMRHFTAAIFAHAGENGDADVAYRNALALSGEAMDVASLPRPPADSADVFVFMDRGFVGHRAEQAVALWLPGDEVGRLRDGDDDARAGTAQLIATRILGVARTDPHGAAPMLHVPAPALTVDTTVQKQTRAAVPHPGKAGGFIDADRAAHDDDDDDDDDQREHAPYLMRIAWPVFREHAPVLGRARVHSGNQAHEPVSRASVSASVAHDFAADRALLVARTVARAAAKLVITRGIEDELREKDETAADIFALLGNVASVVSEQADTRSWTLLPGAIEIARVRVPAGACELTVDANGRQVALPVHAPGGRVVVHHVVLR